MTPSKGCWYLALLSALCILAASVTEVITLTWRNWIQLTIPPDFKHHNRTRRVFIGLWGICGPNMGECFAFHAEGQDLPWHLQISIFLSMFSICLLFLAFCLSFVELMYMVNRKRTFPLKRAQVYLALSTEILSVVIAATMGLASIGGYEQNFWTILKDHMRFPGPEELPAGSRCSLGQAWGFQVLIIVYLTCYLLLARIQLTKTSLGRSATLADRRDMVQEALIRPRIVLLTPDLTGTSTRTHRTPPPAYSPPPVYVPGDAVRDTRQPMLGADVVQERGTHDQPVLPEVSACLHDCPRRSSTLSVELRQFLV
ncbi:hypothetical protein RvY_09544 [Ramazzottius varieornatus]|uniref:Uncharacterized protein n=1 Tax=Ramazzottius varieornatus TaxID=947166 RepID=A0A1D1V9N8_RAMVA|nr:hypothetical protein RvY_09544 [Ramazzottius varieornatus]